MSSDLARELRQQGIAAAKAGRKDEARQLLQQSLRLDATSEPAWLWLASVARDSRERLFCLQRLLEINPNNETALKALAQAQQSGEAAPPAAESSVIRKIGSTAPPPAQPPAAPRIDIMSQPPGIPLPSPESVSAAQKAAEAVVRDFAQPLPATTRWVHKTRRRAGEGDVVVLRLYVAGAVTGFLILLFIVSTVVVLTNDDLRSLVIAPTATATRTPTVTPTWTPGLTPTPSPTPRINPSPTPTVPLNFPAANPFALPEPTTIYPAVLEVPLRGSISLIDRGLYRQALPTLEAERELTINRFNPNPYYYEALALIGENELEEALSVMEEAEERLAEAPNELQYPALVNTGYAHVYWALAQQALSRNNNALASDYLTQVEERATAAIARDPRLADPYLLLSRLYSSRNNFQDAIAILDQGLAVNDLSNNVRLLLEKGRIYMLQRDYDRAEYQSFLVLYIDPTIEAAYQQQIEAALRQNRPGQAVIYAQNYLFYYPGSTRAFKLLGDARVAEGNYDLALAAYNQGLSGDDNPFTAETLVARANLYSLQRRFSSAQDDLTRAFQLTGDPQIQALRMTAAFHAGRYTDALNDADDLLGRRVIPDSQINFVRARALIERADASGEETTAPYTQALNLLIPLLSSSEIARTDLPIVNEYAARANLALGNLENARASIDLAINAQETLSRRYWRGRILEAQNDEDDAAREYEWVVAWSQVINVNPVYRSDAEDRLEALR
ncbi:hypothetical protein FBR02_01085 [Anaerolineae bacterium CFX9]|nr:hypothetical protein [Anaerolineae bacterium CFX9]